jgi:predicted  nucleic acid-binding Zn-ribbon protein
MAMNETDLLAMKGVVAEATQPQFQRVYDAIEKQGERMAKIAQDAGVAAVQQHKADCDIPSRIEDIENRIANAQGIVMGVKWSLGKIIAVLVFILTAGAGIVHVAEKLCSACAACGK